MASAQIAFFFVLAIQLLRCRGAASAPSPCFRPHNITRKEFVFIPIVPPDEKEHAVIAMYTMAYRGV
jgi:hypothetical protein